MTKSKIDDNEVVRLMRFAAAKFGYRVPKALCLEGWILGENRGLNKIEIMLWFNEFCSIFDGDCLACFFEAWWPWQERQDIEDVLECWIAVIDSLEQWIETGIIQEI